MRLDLRSLGLLTLAVLQEFAGEGLRTLAIAYRDLEDKYFKEWHKMLQVASAASHERDEQISALYEEIERDLMVHARKPAAVGSPGPQSSHTQHSALSDAGYVNRVGLGWPQHFIAVCFIASLTGS